MPPYQPLLAHERYFMFTPKKAPNAMIPDHQTKNYKMLWKRGHFEDAMMVNEVF